MKKALIAALAAFVLVFGLKTGSVQALDHDVKRSNKFVETAVIDGAGTAELARVRTEPGKVYLITMDVVAKETAGSLQGAGIGKVCYCSVANIDGTLVGAFSECEGFSGLTVDDPTCVADGEVFTVLVDGNADERIRYIGFFTVRVNDAPNEVTTSTTTTSTSSTTSTTSGS